MLCSHSDNKYLPPVRLEREWKIEPMKVNRKCTPPPPPAGAKGVGWGGYPVVAG